MSPIIFEIGPITLRTYGLLVGLGFLAGYFFSRGEFSRRQIPLTIHDNLVLILFLSGIIGARLFYFGLVHPEYLAKDPFAFLRINEGGLVYYGGFAGALLALFWYAKKKKIPFLVFGDAFAGALLLAQALGRLGCFGAGCCYGRPTEGWWGIAFNHPETLAPMGILLHPTQLYSALGNFLLFLGAWGLSKKNPPTGTLVSFYLLAYGAFRFLIEFVRADYRGGTPLGLHPSQWISLGMIAAGVGLIYVIQKKRTS